MPTLIDAAFLLCVSLLLGGQSCPDLARLETNIANAHSDLSGEHWYEVRVYGKRIGTYQEHRAQLSSKAYELKKTLTFRLMPGRTTTIEEVLRFKYAWPYALMYATETTTIDLQGVQHVTRRKFEPKRNLTHADHLTYVSTLAFHPLLRGQRTSLPVKSVDFTLNEIREHRWQVRDASPNIEIAHADGFVKQTLSHTGIPLHIHANDGIVMTYVVPDSSLSTDGQGFLFEAEPVGIPIDQAIERPHELETLTLRVVGSGAATAFWEPFIDREGLLRTNRNIVRQLAKANTERHRVAAHESALIDQFIDEAGIQTQPTRQSVEHLVTVLNHTLAIEDIAYPSTPAETLVRQTGDCTEFADLFDAIASQLDWQSRIRDDLAYHAATQSFRAHSWNEILVDDEWTAVDASWGQLPADASHVPFPRSNTLALLVHAADMRFEMVEANYLSN
ncbi:MAG: hypothetical protein F4W90_03435 [Gammaproteobacteria bacterium]|nr:hypothetical protein [Gammaproteobacteria bacterium]